MSAQGANSSGSHDIDYPKIRRQKKRDSLSLSFLLSNLADFFELVFFYKIARKYGIDFAPFKAKGQDRYLVFFKAQDTDAMTAAFKEYTEKTIKKEHKPSILAKLAHFKSLIKSAVVDRTKKKELER